MVSGVPLGHEWLVPKCNLGMSLGLRIGLIEAFTVTYDAVFIILSGRQMMTFGVWRWNDAKGGIRFAFPPYGSDKSSKNSGLRGKKFFEENRQAP
jgi:hypothetical protein